MTQNLLIDGKCVAAQSGKTFDRIDPVTNEIATTAAAASAKDVGAACVAAAKAFQVWSKVSPTQRRSILSKAADILEERVSDFCDVMVPETGSTRPWAEFNVMLAAKMLREAAAMTTQIKGEVIPSDKPGTTALAIRQPAGVCVGMAPWNAPVILGVRAIAMPLACGNSVVLKASEFCPSTHVMIGQVLVDAGIPDGVVNVITHSTDDAPKVVEALIRHEAVSRVNFTGSTRVGKIVSSIAAEHLKPVLLELGGKAPLVILDDANIEAAVNAAAFGAFMNQGQICMSTEKIIVDTGIADSFVSKLAIKAAKLPCGNPREKVVLGSVADTKTVTRLQELIDDALSKGATMAAGDRPTDVVMPAIVMDNVTPDMRLYSEESFGPIVSIVRASNIEDAINHANNTEYGLSAAVFGLDVHRALSVAQRIHSGICHINGPTVGDEAQMPFGGTKGSGYGRFGGVAAINEFTDLRWITIEDPQQHYPF